eukprot:1244514-Ditylum_brightwellii.AAC.1
MEKSKQNKHVVCDVDNDVEDGVEDDVDNDSVDDDVDNGSDGAERHLTHLSQAADSCLMERSEQSKHVVCDKDDDVEDDVDN